MLLLKNGKIFTMDSRVVYGDILIENGKIKKIDSHIFNPEAKEIDLKNSIIMPGLIDAHSSLGLIENGVGFPGNDLNEMSDSITPHLSVKDGVNIFDKSFEEARKNGITSTLICPGSEQVVAGQSFVFKTWGKTVEDMSFENPSALQINLGDKVKNSNKNKVEMPMSRMGIAYVIRKLFKEGLEYIKKGDDIHLSDYNIKYESLRHVFLNKIPVIFSADTVQDILTAINIGEEFGLKFIFQSCTEGHIVIDELIKRKIPVFLGPYLTDYSNRELENRNCSTAGLLSKSGILTSIVTNHPEVPIELLTINAAIAVKNGMDYEEALKAITINPAKALGISDSVGSIVEGKDADIVVFSGDPLKVKTKVLMTIVDGEIVHES